MSLWGMSVGRIWCCVRHVCKENMVSVWGMYVGIIWCLCGACM